MKILTRVNSLCPLKTAPISFLVCPFMFSLYHKWLQGTTTCLSQILLSVPPISLLSTPPNQNLKEKHFYNGAIFEDEGRISQRCCCFPLLTFDHVILQLSLVFQMYSLQSLIRRQYSSFILVFPKVISFHKRSMFLMSSKYKIQVPTSSTCYKSQCIDMTKSKV